MFNLALAEKHITLQIKQLIINQNEKKCTLDFLCAAHFR